MKAAEKKYGYIRREKVKKPNGQKGNHLIINLLTPKGKQIIETASKLDLLV